MLFDKSKTTLKLDCNFFNCPDTQYQVSKALIFVVFMFCLPMNTVKNVYIDKYISKYYLCTKVACRSIEWRYLTR